MPDVRTEEGPLLLVTAGGLAREAAIAARAAGRDVIGCLDDDRSLAGTSVAPGLTVVGTVDDVTTFPEVQVVICAGKGRSRALLVEQLRGHRVEDERYGRIVHPSVDLSGYVSVGVGCVLLAGVVLTQHVTIGRHVVCMPNVVVTHDGRLEDFATLCAGVALGGSVTVGREAYVGMSASVREGCRLGPGSMVGMGSVVLRDVPAAETWAGVPARRLGGPS